MSTPFSVKQQIQKLIDDANTATGNTDANLTSAVGALIDGYGSGGGTGDSLFSSRAVGIIPDIPKGYANSEFTLEFTSSAVGSLGES